MRNRYLAMFLLINGAWLVFFSVFYLLFFEPEFTWAIDDIANVIFVVAIYGELIRNMLHCRIDSLPLRCTLSTCLSVFCLSVNIDHIYFVLSLYVRLSLSRLFILFGQRTRRRKTNGRTDVWELPSVSYRQGR